MQRNHSRRFKKVCYNQIKSGTKKLEIKILKASNYLASNHKIFSDIVSKAYAVTDYICKDYPEYFSWYWEKNIPEIFKGTRDVYIAIINKEIAGVMSLKKEASEKKLCTILVLEEYRKLGVATALLEEAFKYLETTKPLISIADYKVDQFSEIIKKYGWEQTQILTDGYYNDTSREIVFNGKIS